MRKQGTGWVLALSFGLVLGSGTIDARAGDDSDNKDATAGVAHKEDADKENVSKKSFKGDAKEADEARPGIGGMGHVRRAKVDLKQDASDASATTGTLTGGAMVTVNEDRGEWIKVTGDGGAAGWAKKDDFRVKAPVVWKSNRDTLIYQECLGKDCEGKKAKDVDKKTELLEIDRGGPDHAYLYVKMPGDQYGWVPVAFMMEWKHKYK